MNYILTKEKEDFFTNYAKIPISFKVASVFDIISDTSNFYSFRLVERKLVSPYTKNFDENPEESPDKWTKKWDTHNWGIFSVRLNNEILGACAVIWDTPNCNMLDNRKDICVLWDIRVIPDYRRKGVGSILFNAAVRYSKERNAKYLKIEAQNNNVNGCRFYKKMGCQLGAFDLHRYKEHPNEAMLLWYYNLQ